MSARSSRLVTVLVAGLLLVPASFVALGPGALLASAQPADEYAVTQAGSCTTVTPLGDGSQSVAEYYDYRPTAAGEYASHGTLEEQATATSNLYLYRGSDGVSLVMLHDRLNDGEGGGTVTFDVSGLPSNATWTVEDDAYDGRDDVFDHDGTESHIEWVWAPNRTDGAAVTGVGEGYDSITIDPGFNSASAQWDSWAHTDEEDRIDTWRVLEGDGSTATTLDLSEPVSISPGPCGVDTPTATVDPPNLTTTVTTEEPTTEEPTTEEPTTEEPTTEEPTTEEPTTEEPTTEEPTTEEPTTEEPTTEEPTTEEPTTEEPTTEEPTTEEPTTEEPTTEEPTTEEPTTEEPTTEEPTTEEPTTEEPTIEEPTSSTTTTATTTAGPSDDDDDDDRSSGGGGGGGSSNAGAGVSQDGGLGVREVSVDGANATAGEPVDVTVTLSNTDVIPHTREFTLHVDGQAVASERVTVDSGEKRTVTFTPTLGSAGEYELRVGAQETTIRVAAGSGSGSDSGSGSANATTTTATGAASTTTTATGTTTAATAGDEEPIRTTAAPTERNLGGGAALAGTELGTGQLVAIGVVAVLGSIAVGTWAFGRD